MNKKPWLAALLNFFLYGAGYVYLGKKKGFGLALILAWILVRIGEIAIYLTGLVFERWLVLFAGLFVFMLIFAYDGYQEAKNM
jgi:hypothetical protein